MYRLQEMNLLPKGEIKNILPTLDMELLKKYRDAFTSSFELQLDNMLPYWLRKRALDEKLSPYELGRVFYHLSQRRGFLSNRKSAAKDNEELGAVKAGIGELQEQISKTNSRTLGEYFASLNPHQQRIRQRWTHRDMYRQEFDAIWNTQKQYHECLTEETHKTLHHALFHQRPLKSAKHLVGKCDLEPSCRRAPYATLEAQEFRLLGMVNNCLVITPEGEERPFTEEEREVLLTHLRVKGDITFAQTKKLLGFKRTAHFTLENGGETRFVGNRVNAVLGDVFGENWDGFDDDKKNLIINDLRCIQKQECLFNRGMSAYGLDKAKANEFAEIELEYAYCNLSRKAIGKILPLMQDKKVHYTTARKEIYGEYLQSGKPKDIISPLNEFADLRNPVVARVLTEMRKVVNNIVRKYGRPGCIRIELARDMKNNTKKRQSITKRNRDNETKRKNAAKRIIDSNTGITNPRRDDILKVQLADECNWHCPYTGKPIGWNSLLGSSPSFDIEHIIPFSRSLDDSFLNKTLCDAQYNRNIKTNRAPGEYIEPGSDQWDTIMGSVTGFKGDKMVTSEKLRRFQLTTKQIEELVADFPSNQLNDTRYASRLACEYLSQLYGGQIDSDGTRRIQAAKGNITYYLREAWQLNHILGDGVKNRDDHRHHAVDAIAVALTTPRTIQQLTRAAVMNYQRSVTKGRFKMPEMPWDNFWGDVQDSIDNIIGIPSQICGDKFGIW